VENAAALAALVERASVLAIGPGLGRQAWGASLFDAAIDCGQPLVVDADALNLLSQRPRRLPPDAVVTPHPGEAARLLGCSTATVQSDRIAAAQSLVERYGCVVVLKGAGSIVAARDRKPQVIAAGNPGMAVGGMGDLLTGVIAALRAQGLPAFDAAACGALLHAVAGDDAAADGGERGLLPSDLLAHLRRRSNPGGAG
jgi:NAD(P)H-hydrate epimerase